MDYSLPASSAQGTFQARILEWVAISFSRGSSQPRDWTLHLLLLLHWQAGSLPLMPPGKPKVELQILYILYQEWCIPGWVSHKKNQEPAATTNQSARSFSIFPDSLILISQFSFCQTDAQQCTLRLWESESKMWGKLKNYLSLKK